MEVNGDFWGGDYVCVWSGGWVCGAFGQGNSAMVNFCYCSLICGQRC